MPSYALCGGRFECAIGLEGVPDWTPEEPDGADLTLAIGAVPPDEARDEPVSISFSTPQAVTVSIANVGRFRVEGGNRIVADIDARAGPGAVETAILGVVLGVLSYQRGLLPLHANTVLIGTKAVALSGRSGVGKSTLAAVLVSRGHRLISDDVLPLVRTGGEVMALPSNQHLRLLKSSLDVIGREESGLRRAMVGEREKFFLPPVSGKVSSPYPLKALIWLESGIAERQNLEHLSAAVRLRTILKAVYRRHLAKDFASMGAKAIADLSLPGVEVYAFNRLRDVGALDQQAEWIERLVA